MSASTDGAVQTVTIGGESDLLRVRTTLRAESQAAGLGLTAATKFVTAGSELARNIIRYAVHSQGEVLIEPLLQHGGKRGVRATFTDSGPGIPDLDAAMTDNYTTGGGLGLGLPGSRRLVDEFSIDTGPDRGTTVVITQWGR
ncbi:ATP-binding protein [Cryptosporangium aurantiacum]|uniref:Serine/threonine-protein kinase RsbT n=1 Tax=Cryptosporangium aurantiacum TaxID=134849 RepID=A0A1M7IHA2_9ACTN|nr:ATP-binding protein [Cryptosporangium aurantiacum]SHM40162.1 serine/threonine-protein kinase RsbT [Cryptosporangium aurantiacum]